MVLERLNPDIPDDQVKEFIDELPNFLINLNSHDFGT